MEGDTQQRVDAAYTVLGVPITVQRALRHPITGVVIIAIVLTAATAIFALANYHVARGSAYLQDGNPEAAELEFKKALRYRPRHSPIYASLGHTALGPAAEDGSYPQANFSAAVGYYERALELGLGSGKRPEAHRRALQNLGYAYRSLGRYEDARRIYLEQAERYPDSFWPRFFVGLDDFHRFNKPQEALAMLSAVVNSQDPDAGGHQFRVAALLARLSSFFGDSVNTRRYANLAVALAPPESPEAQVAHVLLGYELAKEGRTTVALREIDLAQRTAEATGGVDYECAKARVHYLAGDYQRAIAVASAGPGISRGGGYVAASCFLILAETYQKTNRSEEAGDAAQKYLELTEDLEDKNIYVIRAREAMANLAR